MGKRSLPFISLLVLFIFWGCSDADQDPKPVIERSDLEGSWNAYRATYKDGMTAEYPGDILLNYEHGFRLQDDGTYHPRYFNPGSFEFQTDTRVVHHWELVDGNKLTFGDYNARGVLEGLTFEIIRLDSSELWMGTEIQYRLRKEAP